MIKAEGEPNTLVFSGKQDDRVYQSEGGAVLTMPQASTQQPPAKNKEERMERGQILYSTVCFACHQPEGQGIPKAFPPLAKADYLNADVDRAIGTVIHGLSGKITVNGEVYESIMPAMTLNDEQIANVLTYVYNNWENNGTEVTPEQVKKVREATDGTPPPADPHDAPAPAAVPAPTPTPEAVPERQRRSASRKHQHQRRLPAPTPTPASEAVPAPTRPKQLLLPGNNGSSVPGHGHLS
jgi:mono/diheme cytochrome c family protein